MINCAVEELAKTGSSWMKLAEMGKALQNNTSDVPPYPKNKVSSTPKEPREQEVSLSGELLL